MKKVLGFIVVLLFAAILICLVGFVNRDIEDITVNPPAVEANAEEQEIDYLVLVNKQNRLPDDWESKVQLATDIDIDGDEVQVEKEALEKYHELRNALLEEGIDIELDSCYRSVAAQQDLWDRFTEEYGESYVKQYVAVPGYSEHHTGLAIDICIIKDGVVIDDNDDMIAEREIFSRIHAKLADYGFILRYLEGRDDVTGYAYEPWHIRYVGSVDVAKDIMESNITLEEYLAQFEVKYSFYTPHKGK